MSSATAMTGRNGAFSVDDTVIARTTKWNGNPTLATKSEWGDSEGEGWTNRAAGRRDFLFDAEGKYDTDDEVWDTFVPEDIASAALYLDDTEFLGYDIDRALCMDFKIMVDIDTEEVIGWTSSWGSDGPMTPQAGTISAA